ncbi:MAG TPA: PKD domain-containing protein [Conexibacter sp.]
MSVKAVTVNGPNAPVTITVRVAAKATLRTRVNGRAVRGDFDQVGRRRVGHLTAHDGLRPGVNRVRLRARVPGGRASMVMLTVRLPHAHAIADAGRDRSTTPGEPVRLSAGPSSDEGGTHAVTSRRWEVVSAEPERDRATLTGATTAHATLATRRPGVYTVRLTVRGADGHVVSYDTTQVTVAPDDPPAGVPIETLADRPDGQIVIDGKPFGDTADRNGIHIVAIERATRTPVQTGTTPRHGGGIAQLSQIVKTWDQDSRYMVIVSGAKDISAGELGAFQTLLDQLGGPALSAEDRASLTAGRGFSVIGVPGTPRGSAWASFGARGDGVRGDMRGMLRPNGVTGDYDFVAPRQPSFNTWSEHFERGRATRINTIEANGEYYNKEGLPNGTTAGFHMLVLDDALRAVAERTAGTSSVSEQRNLRADLDDFARDYPGDLLIMQSIGQVKGSSWEWEWSVDKLVDWGANRILLNALDGDAKSTYTFVGRIGGGVAPVESSGKTGQAGQVSGAFARGHDWRWAPSVFDVNGAMNDELLEVLNQPAQAFTPFPTAGERAAEQYIAQQLRLCPRDDARCDRHPSLRYYYWHAYSVNWTGKESELANVRMPRTEATFTAAQLDAARDTLAPEVADVANVKNYVDNLRRPFSEGSAGGLADITKMSSDLVADLNPPPADDTVSRVFSYIGQIASGGAGIAEEVEKLTQYRSYFSGVGTAMSVVAYLTEPRGRPVLGDDVKAKAADLGPALVTKLRDAQSAMTNIGLLIVSDRAKLAAAGAAIDSDWVLPADPGKATAEVQLQTRRWIALTLAPVAYPYLVRTTPPGRGGGVAFAQDIVCKIPSIHVRGAYDFEKPFPYQPNETQLRGIIDFDHDGTPVEPDFFFARSFDMDHQPYPTARFANQLFRSPSDPTEPGLGIPRLEFFTPRTFSGRTRVANQLDVYCGNRDLF